MKKFVSALFILFLLLTLTSCGEQPAADNEKYLRIHIRANSNSQVDQDIKYAVKESVVEFLTPLLADCKTKEQAKSVVLNNKEKLEAAADKTLKAGGFDYGAQSSVKNEVFPTRSYNGVVLESGSYDALIISLGTGSGDNWWCVVYPPLCFVGGEFTDGQTLRYRSKLLEIIENFFNK